MGSGAVFGALALAVVLTYRSSGVVNFGTGAIALLTAYFYAFLRQGQLMIPIPGLPKTVNIGGRLGQWPAMALAAVAAALLGAFLYFAVFRPLRTAPAVAKAVAALGIAVLVPALLAQRLGTAPVTIDPIYPDGVWRWGDFILPQDRVYLAVTIVGLAAALMIWLRFSRFGLVTRAVASSERGAYLSGLSPDRIAAYNWMLSSVVAGLAGILIAPITSLAPVSYTLFIVPALAAAVVARFDLAVVAVVAGIGIGTAQSWIQYLTTIHTWLPATGLPELVPLVLILIVLVVRARPLPARGAVVVQALGSAPRPRRPFLGTAVVSVVALILLTVLDDRWRSGLILSLIMAVIGLSVVVVTGYAGQVSLAQLTIAGVAAFLVGPVTRAWHLPFPVAPLVAAFVAAVVGVLIGLPALRIRGLSVAVVTLAMAYAVEAVWFRNTDFVSSSGVATPQPSLFGWNLGIGVGADYPRLAFGVLCLMVLAATVLAVAMLRRSRFGSQMLAVRANEKSAAAAGVNVVLVKLIAFAVGSFIAGLGGALLAYQQQSVIFEPFSAMSSVGFFATVYLAGVTSMSGGVLAGVLATSGLLYIAVDETVGAGAWYPTIAALLLIVTVIVNPEGLVGPVHALIARRRPNDVVTSMVSDDGDDQAARPHGDPTSTGVDESGRVVLRADGVSVHYGGVVALDGVTLSVPAGALVGLIGPNGAGKTTLIDALCGFSECGGSVQLLGQPIDGLAPHQRIRRGIGRTFQALELYDDLSVRENVKVAVQRETVTGTPVSADTVLEAVGLGTAGERPVSELSQGQRQLVSIARALAGNPSVLLLDEPAGGLDSDESLWLGTRLRRIAASGIAVLMVDHDMDLIFGACDLVYVLDFGKVIAVGTPDEIRRNELVAAAYLGSEVAVGA
ncbi:branched-chain amino acid ABC transporter permease/ATP-binding protein [Nocardia sp. alder85J]|uniref:branched-chain amino acid ABC transporter permease/ATP-binding protein n=1 Tax=Nocardia sp. alder85J TaxID=2862949 RepID=UPI0021035841|nr:branched-chain amino acid ABC transporter permease/ATP-binding protein [Nocardia sp. alder85J]MCX4095720.1 branched-chain amino acid ABC transporter permease/ATP-binding protein [Nocardia sp. alder85J]